jgi:hypothetical protein
VAVEERVFMMHDRGRIAENDPDCIEAYPVPFVTRARDVAARGARNVLLFFEIDGAIRMGNFRRGARLDFHEDQQIAASRDNINLRIGAGPVIACDYGEAHLTQIAMRQVLAALAERRFRR